MEVTIDRFRGAIGTMVATVRQMKSFSLEVPNQVTTLKPPFASFPAITFSVS